MEDMIKDKAQLDTRIIIVRHCQSRGNLEQAFHGRTDTDISDLGAKQLECLKERFRNVKLDKLYSSPLTRARKTAEAINGYHNLPVVFDNDLMEMDGGKLEGMLYEKVSKLYPEQFQNFGEFPHLFAAPDGESTSQLYDRAYNTILKIAKANKGQTVAVATHGCLIRCFLCKVLNDDITRLNELEWVDNTSITVVDFDKNYNMNMLVRGDARHLDKLKDKN